jgi:hypothetical protein
MLYCIEVQRELEELCVLHHNFETEPTREDILKFIDEQDMGYDDKYGKIRYYKVS